MIPRPRCPTAFRVIKIKSLPSTSRVPIMSTLSQRFKEYKKQSTELSGEQAIQDVNQMSLEELSKQVIKFGNTHVGKTFPEMFENHTWTQWFLSTYGSSSKVDHAKYCRYCELRLDTEMALSSKDVKTKGYKSGKGKMPKPKPMSAAPTEKSWTHVEPEELCSEVEPDLVDVMEGNTSLQMLQMDDQVQAIRTENLHLSNRMNHVEMALQEILNHLKNTHLKTEP